MPTSDSHPIDLVQLIFDQVADLNEKERQSRLQELCHDDPSLQRVVEELLDADEASEQLFEDEVFQDTLADPNISLEIPGYQLLEEISCGGQGIVYRALQIGTRREVAVKFMLLRESWDLSAARQRFQREVEIICSLSHPGIVPVFDSGVIDGRNYYVMDYIRGQHLDVYSQSHKLTDR